MTNRKKKISLRIHNAKYALPLMLVFTVFGLAFLPNKGMAASIPIQWTATGTVTSVDSGTDTEGLLNATLTLSVTVNQATYGDVFGLAFAPITSGSITISGSSIAANNATHALTFPVAAQIPPYGYSPNFTSNVHDSLTIGPHATLPSGSYFSIAHGITPTASGAAAAPGDPVVFADFATGVGQTFGVGVFSAADVNLANLSSAPATFSATVVPIPAALPLFGSALGLMYFLGWRKRKQV